jgi:type I restriction enzyme S subunit
MVQTISKYPAYKDSGVEWLGEIPEHWECIRMKHLFKDHSEKNKPNAELLSVTQNQGVVPRTWVENRMVMPSGALESFKFINEGDFAISLRSFEGGLEYCYHDGIISPAYTVLKSKRIINNQYYKYLFKSQMFISELQTSVVGIRQGKNISYPELSYSFLPTPSKEEQTAIANFLDNKTALIDKAIALKVKQIELLKERRQILIHRAVTRGLNPDVKLKDSGVEWIGEIPEHWEVKKIRLIGKIINGATPSSGVASFWDGNIIWITPTDINDVFIIDKSERTLTEMGYKNCGTSLVPIGSIILTTRAPIGKLVIAGKELCTNQGCKSIVLKQDYDIKFIYYQLSICSDILNSLGSGTTFMELSNKELKNFILSIPSKPEQKMISEYIENTNLKIDTAIDLTEKEIEKLKEYKSVLINEAVSGKIKVG